jgi:N6-L-threonylcarbamoyladenine synthase
MNILGETIDDAAGEAFDKSAKLLGLPYPGGPLIDRYATDGDPDRFHFPETKVPGLNFSFSGLKTAILYFLQNAGKSLVYKEQFLASEQEKKEFIDSNLPDICASVQKTIVDMLLNKLKKAVDETGVKEVCLAGGVSANKGLRETFRRMGEQEGWATYIPSFEYCTDNAAMIAMTAYYKFLEKDFASLDISPSARAVW